MTPGSTQRLLPALAVMGVAGVLLALPVSRPGEETWQYQTRTLSPGDGAGQDFVLESGRPVLLEFAAAFDVPPERTESSLTADVTNLTAPTFRRVGLPVRLDRARSRLQVRLDGIAAEAGSHIQVELRDPGGQAWLWATEHDSYTSGHRSLAGADVGGDLAFRVFYRRRLVDVGLAGWGVAVRFAGPLSAAGLAIAGGGLLVSGALRRRAELDLAAVVASAIGGGLFTTAVLGLAAAILRLRLSAAMVVAAAVGLAIPGVWIWLRPRKSLPPLDFPAAGLVLGLVVLGLLNLSFVSDLALPPHVDSAIHYSIVSELLPPASGAPAAGAVTDLFARYYHLGFHALSAWVLTLSGSSSPIALVVLGQILQTAAVASVYLLVFLATRKPAAALGAFVLAGVGWTMPGYASNWAKYPALLGLAVFGLIAGVAIHMLRTRGVRTYGWGILLALMALAALMHTRILFLFAGLILAVVAAWRIDTIVRLRTSAASRLIAGGAVVLVVLPAALLLAAPGSLDSAGRVLATLIEGQGAISTCVVLALTPFAVRSHRPEALAAAFFGAAILAFHLIPPNAAYPLPLIDEPLAEMVLFLPMSLLGGFGLAGLHAWLPPTATRPAGRPILTGIALLLSVIYLGGALAGRGYVPGECCQLARPDDVAVLEAARRLDAGSLILIPTLVGEQTGPSPVDGGAWIVPLAQQRIRVGRADADLRSNEEHDRLCAEGVSHVYVGGMPFSYSRTELDLSPEFYSPSLVLPGAALYTVVGCDGPVGRQIPLWGG